MNKRPESTRLKRRRAIELKRISQHLAAPKRQISDGYSVHTVFQTDVAHGTDEDFFHEKCYSTVTLKHNYW